MFVLPAGRPALMGILNVTPDSFSDGGLFLASALAIDHALRMMDEGADLIDVGGESTRPGADEVSAEEEIRRVLPVIEALALREVPVSIDTSKASVARLAVEAGACVVNDVTGFRDPAMILASRGGPSVCIMHMQGTPRTMQESPTYGDVVSEVRASLVEKAGECIAAGIEHENIWLDPGIGFGKTFHHNLEVLNRLEELVDTRFPVLIGVSRKSFIGRVLGDLPSDQRLEGTLAAQALAQIKGVRVIRAHDVLESRRVIDMIAAIENPM